MRFAWGFSVTSMWVREPTRISWRGISEVTYHEGFVRRGDDLEFAVRGGAHAAGCIGDSHGGPDEGFPGIIKDSSRDPAGLLREGERRHEQEYGQNESLF